MAIVSISEAARLTGKSRTTIQRPIKTGKLSKCTDGSGYEGIATSEILRVFGAFVEHAHVHAANEKIIQLEAGKGTPSVYPVHLEMEVVHLKELLEEKDKRIEEIQRHNETLKQAMLMLENKEKAPAPEPTPVTVKKPWWKIFS